MKTLVSIQERNIVTEYSWLLRAGQKNIVSISVELNNRINRKSKAKQQNKVRYFFLNAKNIVGFQDLNNRGYSCTVRYLELSNRKYSCRISRNEQQYIYIVAGYLELKNRTQTMIRAEEQNIFQFLEQTKIMYWCLEQNNRIYTVVRCPSQNSRIQLNI